MAKGQLGGGIGTQPRVPPHLFLRQLVTGLCFTNYRILKPKKKPRRKKKLMNRKQTPQHFTEVGLHWIKTLLTPGSMNLLESSVCLWFSSFSSFLGK